MSTPQDTFARKWAGTLATIAGELGSDSPETRLYSFSGTDDSRVNAFFDDLRGQLDDRERFALLELDAASHATFDVTARVLSLRTVRALRAAHGANREADWPRIEQQLLDNSWGPRSYLAFDDALRKWRPQGATGDVQGRPRLVCLVRPTGRLTDPEHAALGLICQRIHALAHAYVLYPSRSNEVIAGEEKAAVRVELPRHSPDEAAYAVRALIGKMIGDGVRPHGPEGRKVSPLKCLLKQEEQWVKLLASVTFPRPAVVRDWLIEFRLVVDQILSDHAKGLNPDNEHATTLIGRLLFLFLLGKRFGSLFTSVLERQDGEEVLYRLQLEFLSGSGPDRTALVQPRWRSKEPWSKHVNDADLRAYFRKGMGGEDPLIRPFGSRSTLSLCLWSDPGSAVASRSAGASQALDLWKRFKDLFLQKQETSTAYEAELQALTEAAFGEGDPSVCLETANLLLNAIDVRKGGERPTKATIRHAERLIQDLIDSSGSDEQWAVLLDARVCRVRLLGVMHEASVQGGAAPVETIRKAALEEVRLILRAVESDDDERVLTDDALADPEKYQLETRALVARAYYLQAFASPAMAKPLWSQVSKISRQTHSEEALYIAQLQCLAADHEEHRRDILATARNLVQAKREMFAPPSTGTSVPIFISYRSTERALVKEFLEQLHQHPTYRNLALSWWFDADDMIRGNDWKGEIFQRLEDADYFIVFRSEGYDGSEFCQTERYFALMRTWTTSAKYLPLNVNVDDYLDGEEEESALQGPAVRLLDPDPQKQAMAIASEVARVAEALAEYEKRKAGGGRKDDTAPEDGGRGTVATFLGGRA